MFAFDGRWLAAVALGGTVASAHAADAGRLDLLAAEAARVAEAGGGAPDPASWPGFAVLLASTMLAAFLGTWVAGRRGVPVPGGRNWREVAFRFQAKEPVRMKRETLARMAGVLGELEEIGTALRTVPGTEPGRDPAASRATDDLPAEAGPVPAATRVTETAGPPRRDRVTFRRRKPSAPDERPAAPPVAPAGRGGRAATYEQARRLLAEGHAVATVRAMTGLKAAEIDLLRATPGARAGTA